MLKSIICALFIFPSLVLASPVLDQNALETMDYTKSVVITKDMRSAAHRQDEYDGLGLCARSVKYDTQVGANINSPVEANFINDSEIPVGFNDGRIFTNSATKNTVYNVLDIKSKRWETVSKGDFEEPEAYFDFSTDPYDSYRMTMRLRGYINVFGPEIKTFGLNVSSGAILLIAGQPILYSDSYTPKKVLGPQEVTREVEFKSEGLYSIEIIYYENQTTYDFLEVGSLPGIPTNTGFQFGYSSDSLRSLENNKLVDWKNTPVKMSALTSSNLYNTIDGEQTYQCSLCSDNTQCVKGQQCLDGICQNTATACNSNARCGDSCSACPSPKDVCGKGKCVQCISENECKFTEICDMNSNTCVPRPPECTQDSQCQLPGSTSTYVCDTSIGKCALKKPECVTTTDCKANEFCNGNTQKCEVKSTTIACDKDDACPLNDYCDVGQHICVSLIQGQCREQVQCFPSYKCDTAIHTCVLIATPDPSKPSPTGTNPPGGPSDGSHGKTAQNCNYSGTSPSLTMSLFNILSFVFAFRNRLKLLFRV